MSKSGPGNAPWSMLAVIIVALLLGTISVITSIKDARFNRRAQVEEVQRNRELIQQLQVAEEADARNVQEHRIRNEMVHADLCAIVVDIAKQAGLEPKPCPVFTIDSLEEQREKSSSPLTVSDAP